MDLSNVNVAVIGAGPAGSACAKKLSRMGISVDLYEKDKLGGLCLNYGCKYINALKEVSDSIDKLNEVKNNSNIHKNTDKYTLNDFMTFKTLNKKIDEVHKEIRLHSLEKLKKEGVNVIFKRFDTEKEMKNENKNKNKNKKNYDYVVYATGMDYPNTYNEITCNKYSDLVNLKELPEKMVVIGGGISASEISSVFSSLGSEVFTYVRSNILKRITDPDVRKYVLNHIINFNITNDENKTKELLKDENVYNLIAFGGTRPFSVNNNLKVRCDSNNVYACGDAVGRSNTPLSVRQGAIVARNIYNEITGKSLIKLKPLPYMEVIRLKIPLGMIGTQTNDYKEIKTGNVHGAYFEKYRGFNRVYFENGKVVGGVSMGSPNEVAPYFLQYINGIGDYSKFYNIFPTSDPFPPLLKEIDRKKQNN
ncbi:FAD-dependent oxidoreductase [Methanococcus voltae]|uniref:FAD-dependent pyridine nucleotide-disulfide oxidoreductase n=1 Tax=Methanococcus voltae (strain ATCC BAA-1334 / A3) TaxID=456320 RepID=D7DT22_METV3|nr:FAD-dependent oxidoreductase [Methanococcus voltae]MCS3901942.1 dihydrolipoamide dehydrogenase [Methanococcus voltae]